MELVANRSVVELELRRALASRRSNPKNTVLLLRAAPQWHGETEFSVEDKGRQVPVTVAPCATVLAVLDALAADRPDGQHLVVLTPCDTREVGDSVLARAMQPEIKPVDRWDSGEGRVRCASPRPGPHEEGQPLDRRGVARCPACRRLAPLVRDRAQPGHRPEPAGRHPPRASRTPTIPRWTPPPCSSGPPTGPPSRPFSASARTNGTGLISWLTETTGGVADVAFAMAAPARSPTRFPSASPPPLSTVRRFTPRPRARNRRAARMRRSSPASVRRNAT